MMMVPYMFNDDLMDDLFNDSWERDFDRAMYSMQPRHMFGKRSANVMKTDVRETKDGYDVFVDLPGFKKDEIKVSLEDGYLTIEAAKGLDEDEQEKKTGKYIRKERYAGACQRSFYVGDNLTQEDIKGEFKHGILTLNVPKKEAKPAVETNKYIAIEG